MLGAACFASAEASGNKLLPSLTKTLPNVLQLYVAWQRGNICHVRSKYVCEFTKCHDQSMHATIYGAQFG